MADLQEFLSKNPEKENKALQAAAAGKFNQLRALTENDGEKRAAALAKLVSQAESALSEEQLEVVNTFTPCIVPPQNMRDPVKAGQAKDNTLSIRILAEIRKTKDNPSMANAAAERGSERIMEWTRKHNRAMSDADAVKKKSEILAALKEAASLSDTDYELKKQELAKKIQPEKAAPKTPAGTASMMKSKTGKFLLNPDALIPILEARLQKAPEGGLK